MALLPTTRNLVFSVFLLTAQTYGQFSFSADLQNLVVDPLSRNTLWANTLSNDRKVSILYRSKDQGKTWQGIGYNTDPTKAPPIQSIRVHPTFGDRVFVLTNSDGGYVWTSSDGGQTWKNPAAGWPPNLPPQDLFVAAAPSQLAYALIGRQLRRSSDGGATFDGGIETPCDYGFENSPADARRLACFNSSDHFFYVSTDEGRTWTRGAQMDFGISGCGLVNDFRNPLIYLSHCFHPNPAMDFYFRSGDGLRTVTSITGPPNSFTPNFFVSPNRSLILSNGSLDYVISRSRDLGQTWETSGPTGRSFGFDPVDSNIVYLDGKSRSTDAGRTYTDIAGRVYAPLISSFPPIEVTLESGTSYDPQVLLQDPGGSQFTLTSFTPTIPADAPWVRYVQYYTVISSSGLAPGTYETSLGLSSGNLNLGQIAVKLQVVPRRDPPVFLRSNRVAGNGVYREDSGTAGPWPGDNGLATSAPSPAVYAITSDSGGNLYLAFAYRVQKIAPDGTVTNFAGTGAPGSTGDGGGATQATFRYVSDLLKIDAGILILEGISPTRIRLVRPGGTIEAFYTPADGDAIRLSYGSKLAVDAGGTIFASTDTGVYKWQGGGIWTLVFTHAAIAPGASSLLSLFNKFTSFTIDRRDNSFVLGYVDRIVRRSTSGQVTVLLGTPGKTGFAGDGNITAVGSLTENPTSLSMDSRGNIYFAEHNRVRVISSTGVLGTVAGNGDFENPPADNGVATSGGLGRIGSVHVRPNNELAVYSSLNYIFRMVVSAAPTSGIDPGGVVTLAGNSKIAPGAIFSIYGKQLADGVVNSPVPPLMSKLGSTSVQVNGIDIPLFYVSPTQINAQMPYNVPLGTARVRVTRNGVATSDENATIVAAAPDVIQYGAQRAVAVNQNGSINATDAPAPPGSFVVLYLTGIGAVTPALAEGLAAPGSPLSQATLSYKLTLSSGGTAVEANVIFLGLTPTYAGLVQANFQVPALPAGDYTLVLTVGGQPSNATKLAVGA